MRTFRIVLVVSRWRFSITKRHVKTFKEACYLQQYSNNSFLLFTAMYLFCLLVHSVEGFNAIPSTKIMKIIIFVNSQSSYVRSLQLMSKTKTMEIIIFVNCPINMTGRLQSISSTKIMKIIIFVDSQSSYVRSLRLMSKTKIMEIIIFVNFQNLQFR